MSKWRVIPPPPPPPLTTYNGAGIGARVAASLRCSADQALAHPYVAEFHNPDEEPVFPYGPIFINLDDNVKLSAADYRDKVGAYL